MSLGYDVYDSSNRSFEQEGLTGEVRRYTTEKMNFPCYIVLASEEKPVEQYKISVLKKMAITTQVYDEDIAKSMIYIYFNYGNRTVKLASIQAKQVKAFLKLFEANDIDGYFDKDTLLKGDHLYVLAD